MKTEQRIFDLIPKEEKLQSIRSAGILIFPSQAFPPGASNGVQGTGEVLFRENVLPKL
jgi:hypothetical protein